MKNKIGKALFVALGVLMLHSCELDNYDGPNATISGRIIDRETGELIQQDVINGTQIEYQELGYENPAYQYMIFKADGTYTNNLMFAGDYTMQVKRGNCIETELAEITVKGNTVYDFEVTPYLRIKNLHIEREGDNLVAYFNVQQTTDNIVTNMGLYGHLNPQAGQPMNDAKVEWTPYMKLDESIVYTLTLNIPANSHVLKAGNEYYFRVGAVVDAPEAKYNYAAPIRIKI